MKSLGFALSLISLFCCASVSVLSCTHADAGSTVVSILSPVDNSVYPFNARIELLASGIRDTSVRWVLDSHDAVCNTSTGFVSLPSGLHTLALCNDAGELAKVSFLVDSPVWQSGCFVEYMASERAMPMALSSGIYLPSIVNIGSSAVNVSVSHSITRSMHVDSIDEIGDDTCSSEGFARDVSLPLRQNYKVRRATVARSLPFFTDTAVFTNLVSTIGETKVFNVPNPENGGSSVFSISAQVVMANDKAVLWIDQSCTVEATSIKVIWETMQRVMVRCTALWGEWGVTNQDSRIHVLLTPILNDTQVAVGFFNPYDVLPKDLDTSSDSYNPDGNQCNLVTMGIPQESSPGGSFSIQSLCATFSHELMHLIHFERKTRQSLIANSANAPQEEVFLDEGMAHLSESLNGYGILGGNVLFARKYLGDPENFSFSGSSLDGLQDSVGRRGGMLLLLSWLFWHEGGLTLASDGTVMDNGGIAFLHRLIDGGNTGWASLSSACGMGKQTILAGFVKDQVAQTAFSAFPKDPVTSEPLGLSPRGGPYIYTDGSTIQLSGMTPMVSLTNASIASNAVGVYQEIEINEWPSLDLSTVAIGGTGAIGYFFFQWYMKP